MTENFPPAAMPPARGGSPSPAEAPATAEVVRDQASDLSHGSIQAGTHVADVAREQASGVAAEAGRQGRDLLRQAQGQLEGQAAQGQERLASRLLSLSDELRSMADASSRGGVTAGLAHQAASNVRDAGQWLDARDPRQVADEIHSFARRRPAVFFALAAGAGLLAGWLTRGLKDADSDSSGGTAAHAATPWDSEDRRRPSDLPGYPAAAPGRKPGTAHGEPGSLVTADPAGRQGTR
jgi:hypothetical protein